MDKKGIAVVVVFIILVAAGMWYVGTRPMKSSAAAPPAAMAPAVTQPATPPRTSLREPENAADRFAWAEQLALRPRAIFASVQLGSPAVVFHFMQPTGPAGGAKRSLGLAMGRKVVRGTQ